MALTAVVHDMQRPCLDARAEIITNGDSLACAHEGPSQNYRTRHEIHASAQLCLRTECAINMRQVFRNYCALVQGSSNTMKKFTHQVGCELNWNPWPLALDEMLSVTIKCSARSRGGSFGPSVLAVPRAV